MSKGRREGKKKTKKTKKVKKLKKVKKKILYIFKTVKMSL